jgi:hypothetical protein
VTVRLSPRACAVALVIVGAWFALLVPWHPNIVTDDVAHIVLTDDLWVVTHVAMYVVGVVGVLAACGVVAVHGDRLGRVGQATLAVTVFGAIVTAGTGVLEAAVFPEIARRAPETLDFDGPLFTDPLFRVMDVPWMLFPAGLVGLGVLAHRDGAFGRAGAALAAAALGFMLFGLWFVPVIGQVSDVVFGVVLTWWGVIVWRAAPATLADQGAG